MRRPTRLPIVLLILGAGCTSKPTSSSPPPPPPPPPPAAVATVQVAGPTTVAIGGAITLTSTLRDASSNVLTGRSVAWSTSNSSIATVSNGSVTGVAVGGPVTITATSEGKSGTALVQVLAVPVASVVLSQSTVSLAVNATVLLVATPKDAAANTLTGRTVTWSTSNSAIATVVDGLVTGVTAGAPVTITATSEGKTASAQITVTPTPVATVTLSSATATVMANATISLTATTKDAGGAVLTGRTVTWTTSNGAVATVAGGVVTGVTAGGPVTITAMSEGQSATAQVTVTGATAIAAGGLHTCAIDVTGFSYCWGRAGVIGDGFSLQRPVPFQVAGGQLFSQLDLSFDDDFNEAAFTCGLVGAGAAWCWGFNAHGQLGNGTTTTGLTPAPVTGGLLFTRLSLGGGFACGLVAAGSAWCWGRNEAGQIGDGTTNSGRWVPTRVLGPQSYVGIAAGIDYSCGLVAVGDVYCWGRDANFLSVPAPTKILGAPAFVEIGAGQRFGCGRTASGELWCWGGYTGSSGATDPLAAVKITGGGPYVEISVAQFTVCGRGATGNVWCWGDSFSGDGTNVLRTTPTLVSGGRVFTQISAGPSHSCGVVSSGDWYCWGDNRFGQVGDGSIIDKLVPTRVNFPVFTGPRGP